MLVTRSRGRAITAPSPSHSAASPSTSPRIENTSGLSRGPLSSPGRVERSRKRRPITDRLSRNIGGGRPAHDHKQPSHWQMQDFEKERQQIREPGNEPPAGSTGENPGEAEQFYLSANVASHVAYILPRDAVLVRYMPSSCVCLTDCHQSVFY